MYSCSKCPHEPFASKAKLSKHVSNYHREANTIKAGGKIYPLSFGTNVNYILCPECNAGCSNIGNLRRHLNRHCKGSTGNNDNDMHIEEIEGGVETTGTDAIDCTSLEGIGMMYDSEWNVLVCKRCHHIVDQSMMAHHLTKVHKLKVKDEEALWRTMRLYKLRPHLTVIWDESTEQEMDDSDDEGTTAKDFEAEAFRPGSAAISDVLIADGFKCLTCERALTHKCLQSKGAMRTHFTRNHPGRDMELCQVRVQAFYGRSSAQQQLRYVEVTETRADTESRSATDDYATFGIPANVHSVPTSHSAVADKRDLNLFGRYFFAYKMLEWLDLDELGPYLLNPADKSFSLLKRISKKILEDSRAHTSPGFQIMLTKVMEDDDKRKFFHEVQEEQTVDNYSQIWCKVLWIACLAVTKDYTMTRNLTLTPEQNESAKALMEALDVQWGKP
ncbi:uncharacterized protein V1513DRAFT_487754 [Lipomyces chichibuensis]|uniref:uncharacterized protein n=1 Tax=Lipomyces chichibuensis TaxID=1546026 RepID=UPI00334301B6